MICYRVTACAVPSSWCSQICMWPIILKYIWLIREKSFLILIGIACLPSLSIASSSSKSQNDSPTPSLPKRKVLPQQKPLPTVNKQPQNHLTPPSSNNPSQLKNPYVSKGIASTRKTKLKSSHCTVLLHLCRRKQEYTRLVDLQILFLGLNCPSHLRYVPGLQPQKENSRLRRARHHPLLHHPSEMDRQQC